MLQKNNEEIEQQFLGILMAAPRVYDDVSWMKGAYFFNPVHDRIYSAIAQFSEVGKEPTHVFLAKHFESDPDLHDVGGHQYLKDLVDSVLTTHNAKSYAEEILNLHLSRHIEQLSIKMREIADSPGDAAEKIRQVEEVAFNLRLDSGEGEIKNAQQCMDIALANIDAAQKGVTGIKTGIDDLDGYLKGLKPGKLYIMAGRPAMGKSALALNVAENSARRGSKVLFFAQEMDAGELYQRIIARITGIPVDRQNDRMSDAEIQRIFDARTEISALNLHVDDATAQTVSSIMSKARKHKRKYGLDMIVIDYLGLMDASNKSAQMVHQIAEMTRGLKNAATMLGVPVILLAQLNRGVESRDNKRPMLSDLRDSGSIEQDADVVMLLYREEYYLEREKPEPVSGQRASAHNDAMADWQAKLDNARGMAEIIVAKNRQGRVGTVKTTFDGARQVFGE